MSMEVGVVVFEDGHYWHEPDGSTSGSLPDSWTLWDVLWENRDRLVGFAHSHPGSGVPAPSHTDISTFRAVEQALGRNLEWWVISRDHVVLCTWERGSTGTWVAHIDEDEHVWLDELRRLSYTEVSDG